MSVDHAYGIDNNNKDKFWRYATRKEMHNHGISFYIIYSDQHVPVGWRNVTGHMVFDVNMYFTRKALWVLNRPINSDPEG